MLRSHCVWARTLHVGDQLLLLSACTQPEHLQPDVLTGLRSFSAACIPQLWRLMRLGLGRAVVQLLITWLFPAAFHGRAGACSPTITCLAASRLA
jgi:hypothetical protein